jgi:hypothetical protein
MNDRVYVPPINPDVYPDPKTAGDMPDGAYPPLNGDTYFRPFNPYANILQNHTAFMNDLIRSRDEINRNLYKDILRLQEEHNNALKTIKNKIVPVSAPTHVSTPHKPLVAKPVSSVQVESNTVIQEREREQVIVDSIDINPMLRGSYAVKKRVSIVQQEATPKKKKKKKKHIKKDNDTETETETETESEQEDMDYIRDLSRLRELEMQGSMKFEQACNMDDWTVLSNLLVYGKGAEMLQRCKRWLRENTYQYNRLCIIYAEPTIKAYNYKIGKFTLSKRTRIATIVECLKIRAYEAIDSPVLRTCWLEARDITDQDNSVALMVTSNGKSRVFHLDI